MHQVKNYIRHFFTAHRKGHNVHSPFAYTLCEEVFYNKNEFYDFTALKKLRNELLNDNGEIIVEDFGAGSKVFKTANRSINSIVKNSTSTVKQSELLYKLINFLRPKTIIELGTSIGLNTLYLCSANSEAQVYSMEGSSSLCDLAKQLAKANKTKNCSFIQGNFDDKLPGLLNELDKLDFFYVDGNHTYEGTLKYFDLALKKKHEGSVFVFDDIYWSEGMTKAWHEIQKHPAVTLSIDTFFFGMVFFRKEIKEKVDLKFYI